MKREKNLINRIAEPDNLRLAYIKARKGKEFNPEVTAFTKKLDKNIKSLYYGFKNNKLEIGKYKYFTINDPKERVICAAAFKERVMQHAIMNICHDNFEKYQIDNSYACRKNKGTYAALDKAKVFNRKYKWHLKLDARKYFDSIDHNVMFSLLEKRFKDEELLLIFWKIIKSYKTKKIKERVSLSDSDPIIHKRVKQWIPVSSTRMTSKKSTRMTSKKSTRMTKEKNHEDDKGIPIGNLTSQYFANHYLGQADHHLLEKIGIDGYIRYMDDMVLWGNDKGELLEKGREYIRWMENNLLLELKPVVLNSSSEGLSFLGYKIYPDRVMLTQISKRRFIRKFLNCESKLAGNEWSQKEYQNHILPLLSFVRKADTFKLRESLL